MAKLTPNQQLWSKEVKRINRFMRELKAQGFVFDLPPDFIPARPARVTKKQLRLIRAIKPETVRSQSRIVPEWYREGRKTPPGSKATKTNKKPNPKTNKPKKIKQVYLPREDVMTLFNIESEISKWTAMSNWTPYWAKQKERDRNILKNILDGAVYTYGRATVALRLKAKASEVNTLIQEILYGSGGKTGYSQIQLDLKRFTEIVHGRALSIKEAKDIEAYLDNLNSYED